MNVEQNELWFVEANGQVFETNFDEMTSWIADGSLMPGDRVRRGNLRWIEAAKVPSLIEFFNGRVDVPAAPTVTAQPFSPGIGQAAQTTNFSAPISRSRPADPSQDPVCSVHDDTPATYICDTCTNLFCKTCPNSYGGTVKICPFCGAMCHPIATVAAAREAGDRVSADVSRGFGLRDLAASLAYPLKFKMSLVMGAVLFMIFSIGESAVFLGGIFMLVAAIFCFLFANTLTFGILANTVENFSQGKIGLNFMPSFEDFSAWDDVVHPFFLTIGTYLVSFGPLMVFVAVAVFTMTSSFHSSRDPERTGLAEAVAPDIAGAGQSVKQGLDLKQLVAQTAEQQKARNDALNSGNIEQAAAPQEQDTEDQVKRAGELIKNQQKAELESTFGRSPDTTASDQRAIVQRLLGYGTLFFLGLIVLGLWGLFYFPAACCVAAYTRSFAATLNPAVGLDTIKRLGLDYLKILGMTFIISVVSGVVGLLLASVLSAFDLPGLGNVPARAISSISGFYFAVVFSCIIGFALYKASDRLKLYR